MVYRTPFVSSALSFLIVQANTLASIAAVSADPMLVIRLTLFYSVTLLIFEDHEEAWAADGQSPACESTTKIGTIVDFRESIFGHGQATNWLSVSVTIQR